MQVQVITDCLFQYPGAAMDSATDLFVGEQGKESFDHVDPGGTGWCEVDMESRSSCQPAPDQKCLVGSVVVHDHVYVEFGRDRLVNGVEELAEFDRPVTAMAFPDHFAGFGIQCSEQSSRPVAFVVVASPLRLARSHRQNGL